MGQESKTGCEAINLKNSKGLRKIFRIKVFNADKLTFSV